MPCSKIGLHKIIQELISNQSTKVEIGEKYTGEEEHHWHTPRFGKKTGEVLRLEFSAKSTALAKPPTVAML